MDTALSNNSFMNKINYFWKQKLILFFSAWLTQDLATKSHLKTKLILFSSPWPSWIFPPFLARLYFYIFFSQTIFVILFQARVDNLDIAPKDIRKFEARVILSWGNLGLASWEFILTWHPWAKSVHQSWRRYQMSSLQCLRCYSPRCFPVCGLSLKQDFHQQNPVFSLL